MFQRFRGFDGFFFDVSILARVSERTGDLVRGLEGSLLLCYLVLPGDGFGVGAGGLDEDELIARLGLRYEFRLLGGREGGGYGYRQAEESRKKRTVKIAE